jgi:hypothetical protein
MEKIKKLLTIGLVVLLMLCVSINLVGCKEEKIFIGSEDYLNPTALEINLQPKEDEYVFDGDITISKNKKYFELYFSSDYKYSILFDGHSFTYKIYNLSNITTPIVDRIAGAIVPFPSASNSYLLEIEGYENMAELTVNMTIKRYLK